MIHIGNTLIYIHTWRRFNNHAGQSLYAIQVTGTSIMAGMNMGNIAARAILELTPFAFRSSVLTISPTMRHDGITITYLCGCLLKRAVQSTMVRNSAMRRTNKFKLPLFKQPLYKKEYINQHRGCVHVDKVFTHATVWMNSKPI